MSSWAPQKKPGDVHVEQAAGGGGAGAVADHHVVGLAGGAREAEALAGGHVDAGQLLEALVVLAKTAGAHDGRGGLDGHNLVVHLGVDARDGPVLVHEVDALGVEQDVAVVLRLEVGLDVGGHVGARSAGPPVEALEAGLAVVTGGAVKLDAAVEKPVDVLAGVLKGAAPEVGIGAVVGVHELVGHALAHGGALDVGLDLHAGVQAEGTLGPERHAADGALLLDEGDPYAGVGGLHGSAHAGGAESDDYDVVLERLGHVVGGLAVGHGRV